MSGPVQLGLPHLKVFLLAKVCLFAPLLTHSFSCSAYPFALHDFHFRFFFPLIRLTGNSDDHLSTVYLCMYLFVCLRSLEVVHLSLLNRAAYINVESCTNLNQLIIYSALKSSTLPLTTLPTDGLKILLRRHGAH